MSATITRQASATVTQAGATQTNSSTLSARRGSALSSGLAVAAMLFGLVGGPGPAASADCKPVLRVQQASLSPSTNMKRYWHARVAVDASRCENSSGLFALGFTRLAENAPDLEFVEPFIWRAGETKVRVEFWGDETVQSYWIADVASCRCRPE
jgi:hypothetical protein